MSFSLAVSIAVAPLSANAAHVGYVARTSLQQAQAMDTTATNTTTSSSDSTLGQATRLETYRKNLKEVLTAAAKARIAERCVAAQAIVKGKSNNNGKSTEARTTVYNKIVSELQALVSAASEKSVSVTDLQANIAVLQTKILSFTASNKLYQQELGDLSALDCKVDPTAFKAALEAARADQLATLAAAKDVRSYFNDTIKVTLKALKSKLNGQE